MVTRPETLYLIKGKLYSNVVSCEEIPYRGGRVYEVVYRRSDGATWVRNQSIGNVKKLPYSRTEEGRFRFRDQKGSVWAASRVHWYGNDGQDAICIESSNGYLSYGSPDGLSLEESLFDNKPVRVFDYLSALSDISRLEDENGRVVSLRQKYDNVSDIFSDSVFAHYCMHKPYRSKSHHPGTIVFPFGCNASQYDAVKNALTNRISFIQGPPGTGKTQTILNIVANLLLQDKTCLVVSNNNSAVTNVVEKLSRPEYGFDFLVAVLGREMNKESFMLSQTGKYPDLSSWRLPDEKLKLIESRMSTTSKSLPDYFGAIERIAQLTEKIEELKYQLSLSCSEPCFVPHGAFKHRSRTVYDLILRLDSDMAKKESPRFSTRILFLFKGFGIRIPERDTLMSYAWRLDLNEITAERDSLKAEAEKMTSRYNTFCDDSLHYLKSMIYRKIGGRQERTVFEKRKLFSPSGCQEFLKEYPVVTSTNFSSTSCINSLVPFDYIIMDEASQVDIVSGALALNTALSAVIVGDQMQLPNVVTQSDASIAERVFQESNLSEEYKYVGNSFLDSMLSIFPSSPAVLLKEHYRCDPLIIGFCNRRFYDGKLVVMTQRNDDVAVSVIKTVEGDHLRGLHNQRQAEEVVTLVKEILPWYRDIGVIAPYNEQVNLIQSLLLAEGITGVKVATVHKFQGRENDVIIMSTVDNSVSSFVDDPHLLNVAVSRAKHRFILVVGSSEMKECNIKALVEYISYYGGESKGQIHSVFDLLYERYAAEREVYIGKRSRISQFDSENIIYSLLKEITDMPSWRRLGILFQYPLRSLMSRDTLLSPEEAAYANHSWTLVDFVLYDRVTHLPVLAIEVDGVSFHRKGTKQYTRDLMKDEVLRKSGLSFLRLSTEGSGEKEKIIDRLSRLMQEHT